MVKTKHNKRKQLKKQTKKQIKKLKKRLHRKIWKVFSEWVRRSADGVCYCCGKKQDWRKCHAGHYIHNKFDYSPINVKCLCSRCNTFLHGNLGVFAENLIREYGLEQVESLRERAKESYDLDITQLERLLEFWQNKLKEL